uniref:Glycoside hydrolase n=1 Tax=viral metagenome TaxID=1070528 RepID=A0A6M3LIR7_9ZZZZ
MSYPDENSWWNEFTNDVNATYNEAQEPLNDGKFKWFTRTAYDIGAGLEEEQSRVKHLNELRAQLGLELLPIPEPAPIPPLSEIGIDGIRFIENGKIWKWRGFSDFLLFYLLANGGNLRPIIQNRRNYGANVLRVFGMWPNPPLFRPQDYPHYFDDLNTLADLLAEERMRMEFTVFAGAQIIIPYTNNQLSFFNQVVEVLQPKKNVFIELVNEYKQNGIKPENFSKPSGIISCAGSPLGDEAPPLPAWDYSNIHTRRDTPKWMMQGPESWWYINGFPEFVGVHQPVVNDEPIGAGEVNQEGRRTTDASGLAKLAMDATAFGNGITFHSEDGIYSRFLGPNQDNCARGFFHGCAVGAQL